MGRSMLVELWETVYAKGSVIHMQSGHAFSPSLRAHILTSAALIGVLMGKPGVLDSIDKDHLANLYGALLNQDKKVTAVPEKSVSNS